MGPSDTHRDMASAPSACRSKLSTAVPKTWLLPRMDSTVLGCTSLPLPHAVHSTPPPPPAAPPQSSLLQQKKPSSWLIVLAGYLTEEQANKRKKIGRRWWIRERDFQRIYRRRGREESGEVQVWQWRAGSTGSTSQGSGTYELNKVGPILLKLRVPDITKQVYPQNAVDPRLAVIKTKAFYILF